MFVLVLSGYIMNQWCGMYLFLCILTYVPSCCLVFSLLCAEMFLSYLCFVYYWVYQKMRNFAGSCGDHFIFVTFVVLTLLYLYIWYGWSPLVGTSLQLFLACFCTCICIHVAFYHFGSFVVTWCCNFGPLLFFVYVGMFLCTFCTHKYVASNVY